MPLGVAYVLYSNTSLASLPSPPSQCSAVPSSSSCRPGRHISLVILFPGLFCFRISDPVLSPIVPSSVQTCSYT